MKGIIIYKSKYGATKKYAEWISEATGFPCVTTKEADMNKVSECDVVKKNIGKLKGKKVLVYTCAASPYDKKFYDALIDMNMKDELKGIPVFYCRGAFDLKNMSFADRALCKMLRKAVAKKDPKDWELWESALMECKEDEGCDWTDKSYIEPIVKEALA